MKYSITLSLKCPYCNTKTQFTEVGGRSQCNITREHHIIFLCTHCKGLILSNWDSRGNGNPNDLLRYYKIIGDYKTQINLQKIERDLVRKDFTEAIDCYNNGFYNASMVMSRRSIQQEIEGKEAKGKNLYEKINSLVTSENLKKLLNKIKNFGNSGAHPDFFLYGEEGEQLISVENEKDFAKLALTFLDKYFQDQYEMQDLIANAPNSDIENKTKEE
ncbi:MAG: DUF4145 domain-containing protein [Patescibacteria group bacterium]|jgi:hypothetical protein|nr:DUF4145 domain-containing protein [Patescibacteria group bacterium]